VERFSAAARRFGAALRVAELPGLEALAVLNQRSVCRRYSGSPVPEDLVRLLRVLSNTAMPEAFSTRIVRPGRQKVQVSAVMGVDHSRPCGTQTGGAAAVGLRVS
jgi:hypothetical protein